MPPYPALPGRPRTTGRLARGPELAASLAARLTARDRWLLRMLHEHRVLTTTQITQLAFGTTRAASARLTTLYQHRAIDRFRPLAPAGSAPLHWVLDEAGAAVLAAEDGITAAELGYRRDRALAIALSAELAHTTGANGFFTALAAAARASSGHAALDCWWSERRCAAEFGGIVRPDGYGTWAHDGRVTRFFLEYDNGTETTATVAAKLGQYADLATAEGAGVLVLLWLPAPAREAALRPALARPAPAREVKNPLTPSRWPSRWLAAQDSARPSVTLRAGAGSPHSAAISAAPAGAR